MNKSLVLLVATLFVANTHADFLTRITNYHTCYQENKDKNIDKLFEAATKTNNSDAINAVIKHLNQETASAQLKDKLTVVAFSTALTGFVTMGFAALMEWYQNFRIRRARTSKEVARIDAEKNLANIAI